MSLEQILKRDRFAVALGLILITALSWGWMIQEAASMNCCKVLSAQKSGGDFGQLMTLFVMWAVMMVAMMVPSVAPMVLVFAKVNRTRLEKERPYVPTVIFLTG